MEKNEKDKKTTAQAIIVLLEDLNIKEWEKIKQIIDDRYTAIKNKSNFSIDKVTLNRIESWF
jgi:hypothetical protein